MGVSKRQPLGLELPFFLTACLGWGSRKGSKKVGREDEDKETGRSCPRPEGDRDGPQ